MPLARGGGGIYLSVTSHTSCLRVIFPPPLRFRLLSWIASPRPHPHPHPHPHQPPRPTPTPNTHTYTYTHTHPILLPPTHPLPRGGGWVGVGKGYTGGEGGGG